MHNAYHKHTLAETKFPGICLLMLSQELPVDSTGSSGWPGGHHYP